MVIVEAQENLSSRPVKYRRPTVTGILLSLPKLLPGAAVKPAAYAAAEEDAGNFRETADARLTHGPITLVPSPFISRARLAGSALPSRLLAKSSLSSHASIELFPGIESNRFGIIIHAPESLVRRLMTRCDG